MRRCRAHRSPHRIGAKAAQRRPGFHSGTYMCDSPHPARLELKVQRRKHWHSAWIDQDGAPGRRLGPVAQQAMVVAVGEPQDAPDVLDAKARSVRHAGAGGLENRNLGSHHPAATASGHVVRAAIQQPWSPRPGAAQTVEEI